MTTKLAKAILEIRNALYIAEKLAYDEREPKIGAILAKDRARYEDNLDRIHVGWRDGI